jgi:hypothetical protein
MGADVRGAAINRHMPGQANSILWRSDEQMKQRNRFPGLAAGAAPAIRSSGGGR